MRILVFLILFLLTTTSYAQLSRKEKKAARKGTAVDQPTTLDPARNEPVPVPKHVKRKEKKASGPTYNAQNEFDDRMNDRIKTYRKNEKNMMTPQYKNPAYFGHKRPPKKRPADKMKFCKVCGIRH